MNNETPVDLTPISKNEINDLIEHAQRHAQFEDDQAIYEARFELSTSDVSKPSENRQFRVHPQIIKTLIKEQSGSLPKAFAELIMNSVDAGSTRIDVSINAGGNFTIRDDGSGFKNRQELDSFWETFGTPHLDGDAYYGRFRIGRGQIMSYASTTWRSGYFEMTVDLEADHEMFGYDLTEHQTLAQGCVITGSLYMQKGFDLKRYFRTLDEGFTGRDRYQDDSFESLIRFVPVPVFINGSQVNTPPNEYEWDMEDNQAWYKFDRKIESLEIFNLGVFVTRIYAGRFGVGGVISSKTPLKVNLARSSLLEHECAAWRHIEEVIHNRFARDLEGVKRLNQYEASALLQNLSYSDEALAPQVRKRINSLRFIPDIFGTLQTPESMLAGEVFTLFDGEHTGIAELVQRQGLATVLMPRMLRTIRASISDENAVEILNRLRAKIYLKERNSFRFLSFSQYVEDLRDTSILMEDSELNKEESLILDLLRDLNLRVARMTNGRNAKVRKIVAGKADFFSGWTDAISYIAINREKLSGMRWESIGSTGLITLMVHEYAHLESSTGDHDHDYEFLNRFHEAMFSPEYARIVTDLQKNYLSGLCKHNIVPSAETGAYVRRVARISERLPRRVKAKRP